MRKIETMEIALTNVVALRERAVGLVEQRKATREIHGVVAASKYTNQIMAIINVAKDLGIDLRIDREKNDFIVHEWSPRRRLDKFEMGALSTIKHMELKLKEIENGEYIEEEFIWTGDDSEVITKKFTKEELEVKAQGIRDSINTITKLWRLEAHI